MENNLRLTYETVKELRNHIRLARNDQGKEMISVSNKETYQIVLCDIWEMLYLLMQDKGNYSGNDTSESKESGNTCNP